MSATILSGRDARDVLMKDLIEKRSFVTAPMKLAIIQVGDRPDSTAYIAGKQAFAKEAGIETALIQLGAETDQENLMAAIEACNRDKDISGIILQLPLPIALDAEAVIEKIDPRKDVDGLTSHNVKKWSEGREDAIVPATARGVIELLKYYKIDLFGKKVVVVGRSLLVGRPIAAVCLAENATVTVCHSKTPDLAAETSRADILIVAAGKPGLITAEHVRPGQTVIDVGISKAADGTLAGDVDYASVSAIVGAITPVPGGVGPMTVLALFENMIDLSTHSYQS